MRTFVSNVYYIVGPPAVGKSYLMSQINYFLEKHKNSEFIRFINEDDAVLTYIGFKEGVALKYRTSRFCFFCLFHKFPSL